MTTTSKRCTGECGKTYPQTAEFFHIVRYRRNGAPIFRGECKTCRSLIDLFLRNPALAPESTRRYIEQRVRTPLAGRTQETKRAAFQRILEREGLA